MKPLRPLLVLAAAMFFFNSLFAESLKVGDSAPTVSGVTDAGTPLDLGQLYQQHKYVVVWFYPKALTGGCTKQGCSLRDAAQEIAAYDATIVGVSFDSVEKQREFKEKNNFPFPLIADTEKTVTRAFGQSSVLVPSRECYVISGGKIVYKDTGVTDKQAENVLAFLASQKK
jgi:peroxiredoxin Q/BCP